MDRIGPNKTDREREALLAQIRDAFKGVRRDGGVSWSETFIDDHATDHDRAAARARDKDTCWTKLIHDPEWLHYDGPGGGFSCLDAIGFRYYLPAAMIRSIETAEEPSRLCSHLTLPPTGDTFHDGTRKQWSLLDRKQRLAIKRFARYMEATDPFFGQSWREAYDSYWRDI